MDDMRLLIETNFFGTAYMTQAVAPHMMNARSGVIVNIGSMVGDVPTPFSGVYSASKAAVHAYSTSLRMELAPWGIKVVIAKLGGVKSSISSNATPRLMSLLENSWYQRISEYVIKRSKQSQAHPVPAEVIAHNLVDEIFKNSPRPVVIWGSHTGRMWLMKLIPYWLSDFVMSKLFGLLRMKDILAKEKLQ